MSHVMLAVTKSPFTIFPGFPPKDAGQGDEESIRLQMPFDVPPSRFGHFHSGFQSVEERVVMEDARGDARHRWQDQVGFRRVKVAARRMDPPRPRAPRS